MFRSVVPNLFLPVAHFHFENFPWPLSQSIVQELDPNFHQSWIRLKRFSGPENRWSPKKKKKKVFTEIQTVISAENSWSAKKNKNKSTRHSPQLSASFLTMSGNKQLFVQIRLSNQNALWPTAKYFCGLQVENHWLGSSVGVNNIILEVSYPLRKELKIIFDFRWIQSSFPNGQAVDFHSRRTETSPLRRATSAMD